MVVTVAGTPGKNSSTGNNGPALAATLNTPGGILYDEASGTIMVTEVGSGKARIILPDGTILSDPTLPGIGRSLDLAATSTGELLFAVSDKHFVGTPSGDTLKAVAGQSGKSGSTGDNAKASAALLNTPAGLAAATSANMYYIADSLNHKVRLVSESGNKISTVAGTTSGYSGDGGLGTAAKLNTCTDVALDPWGNLFIADTGGARPAQLPWQLHAQRADGPRLPADSCEVGGGPALDNGRTAGGQPPSSFPPHSLPPGNHRVRRLDGRTKVITTVAGNGTQGFSGDGGPATAARLSSPMGLAVDVAGNVYIADSGRPPLADPLGPSIE
jgi:hypothetical protein